MTRLTAHRRRLALGVIIINLFIMCLIVFSLYQSYQRYIERSFTTAQNLSRSLAVSIAGNLNKIDVALFCLARETNRQLALGGIEPEVLNQYMDNLHRQVPDLEQFWVADADGFVRYGTLIHAGETINITDREYFLRVKNASDADLVISNPVIGRITKTWSILVCKRITGPNGSFAGVAFGSLRFVDFFSSMLSSIDTGKQGAITISDNEFGLIFRYRDRMPNVEKVGDYILSREGSAAVQANPDDGFYSALSAIDGIKRNFSYSRLASYPLYVFVGQSTQEFLAPWKTEAAFTLMLLLGFTIFTAATAWVLDKRMEKAVALEVTAREYASKLDHALKASQMGVWHLDVGENRSVFDDKVCHLLGIDPAKFSGTTEEFFEAVHPEDHDVIRSALAQTIEHGVPYEVDYRAIWPDGSIHYITARGTLITDVKCRPLRLNGLLWDITERKRMEEELQKSHAELELRVGELVDAKERAEAADRIKSVFLATMSHELRTPLNSIIGFTGILQQELSGPLNEEQKKQLGMVRTSGTHLLNLINDVLDISKIEAGQLQVSMEPFNLREVIQKVTQASEPLALKKRLGLEVEIAPDIHSITSDRRRVEQVLINLLSNAIKFTEEGRIRVICSLDGRQVSVTVTDTGIGIKGEDMDRLFKPFQQVQTGAARHFDGTGLGLSICKKLLDLLGGRIAVHSQWGKGSTFSFTLPLER